MTNADEYWEQFVAPEMRKFLKSEQIYYRFLRYLAQYQHINGQPPAGYWVSIDGDISWAHTNEGYYFWKGVYNRWNTWNRGGLGKLRIKLSNWNKHRLR